MKKRTWTYEGNISSFSSSLNLRGERVVDEIELYDIEDDSKAPVLLHVSCSLMGYIMDLEWHDDEEKYMRKMFVYDDILCIREILILNKDGKVCKIIREADEMGWTAMILGPRERIDNVNQKPLDGDEKANWIVPESFKE